MNLNLNINLLQYHNMITLLGLYHLQAPYCPAPSVQSSTSLPGQDPAVPARLPLASTERRTEPMVSRLATAGGGGAVSWPALLSVVREPGEEMSAAQFYSEERSQ